MDVGLGLENSQPVSSSASKRKIGGVSLEDDWSDVGVGNIILNVELLSKAIVSFCVRSTFLKTSFSQRPCQ